MLTIVVVCSGKSASVIGHLFVLQCSPTNIAPEESFRPVNNIYCIICSCPCFLNIFALSRDPEHPASDSDKISIPIQCCSSMEYFYRGRDLLGLLEISYYSPLLIRSGVSFACHHNHHRHFR
ncbi:hypothetical protein EE612_042559 [Oryza sativa]|nr:hypothetical protein EE612_042559 [Oryza sativa]